MTVENPVPSMAHIEDKTQSILALSIQGYLDGNPTMPVLAIPLGREEWQMVAKALHAAQSTAPATGDMEAMRVTLGCCLALMAQSGNAGCIEMAQRIPFTLKNGEPYALVGQEIHDVSRSAPSAIEQTDPYKRRPTKGQCNCGQHEVPAGCDGVQWYWQRHTREACTLELPNLKCWCGLLRSEHLTGHKEGAVSPENATRDGGADG